MKRPNKLLIALAIVAALIIGFLIGISVEYPRLNNSEVLGTIGKVNNYRNAQVTEVDIQLKNELLADSVKLKSIQKYLNFYYVTAVKMAGDIEFAVQEANAVDDFKSINQAQITNLASYGELLSKARKDLLLALSASKTAKDVDPALLRELLNKSNNMVAQMNYRNRSVLDFIDAVALFIKPNNLTEYEGLSRAHDILTLNEINASVMTGDKLVLKSFDKKALFNDHKNLKWVDEKSLNDRMQQDYEKLGRVADAEKLGFIPPMDAEKIGIALDAEKLGFFVAFDVEKLGAIVWFDAEKLGAIPF